MKDICKLSGDCGKQVLRIKKDGSQFAVTGNKGKTLFYDNSTHVAFLAVASTACRYSPNTRQMQLSD